ncbi:hypothetical protein ACFVHQ_01315 [Actinomycetes bacterium NPDC127524]
MRVAHIEEFAYLSNFSSLKEFNNSIEQQMLELKGTFTKSESIAIKRLIRYAAKIPGVCLAKIGTIVAATHRDGEMGISRSTFKRAVLKARDSGLLTIHELERKNGSQTANLYVFNRISSSQCAEPPKGEQLDRPENYQSFEINNIKEKERNNTPPVPEILDASFTSERVPAAFTKIVSCIFDDFRVIEEFWRMTGFAFKGLDYCRDTMLNMSVASFKQTVRAIKKKTLRRNKFAYYWGILQKKLDELYFSELFELGF